ncbi:PhzF family phenazine biosynthesis protein [Hoyosella sp. G463]|uniref:PhzF family phenazine biosynthesis protein n=1 Tax=Lolliginicoccus lacisalsi TaxID=2742202 RepID=A0A927JDK0_9ACTN|nr:PhzF family phenazine biosynthesis protein [Lolliginicoccus lacisalsi]
MTALHVIRVFCDESGQYGNLLAVVLDGAQVPAPRRQQIAAELGFSETVFVDDRATGRVHIFTPAGELPLAGHPLVGTAWLLAHEGSPVTQLNPPAGPIPTWTEGEQVWIQGPLSAAPPWRRNQLPDAGAVEAMVGPPSPGHDADQFWAWINEDAATVRARVFANRYRVHEDEACGSASMLLAHDLGRAILIHHGKGSIVSARPGPNGTAEVGGRVALDHIRHLP